MIAGIDGGYFLNISTIKRCVAMYFEQDIHLYTYVKVKQYEMCTEKLQQIVTDQFQILIKLSGWSF